MIPGKKYILLGSILIALTIIIITTLNLPNDRNDGEQNDFFRLYKTQFNDSDVLLEDSLVEIPTNDTILFLIKDNNKFIHFIMSDRDNILLNSNIPIENRLEDSKLEWQSKHINEHRKYAFYGIVYDKTISKLLVNNKEIPIFRYLDQNVFFSTEKLDVPILIEGYSTSGELIYKNLNDGD